MKNNKEAQKIRQEQREEAETAFGEIPLSDYDLEEAMEDQESFRELRRDRRHEQMRINSDE